MNKGHKICYLIMVSLLFTITVFSQNPGFNRFYKLSESDNTQNFQTVIENSLGYVTIGNSYFCNNYDTTCGPVSILFSQFNTSGDFLWSRQFSSDTVNIRGAWCKAVKSRDAYEVIINCEDTINGISHRFPALIRFNDAGEVIFLKEISRPDNLVSSIFFPYISIKTIDDGFLIGCTISGRQDYLMKVNKNLQTEWAKPINLLNKKGYIHSLYQTSDSCYLIGLSIENDNKLKLVYYNSEGQLNWLKNSGSELKNFVCQVLEGTDSSLIIISDYTVFLGPYGSSRRSKFQFTAFDKSGQLKSTKIIGDTIAGANLTGAFTDSDGTIVFYGAEGNGHWINYANSFIFRVGQSGDSLFYRKVKPRVYSYLNSCNFMDGIPTSDGNLLFCGLQAIDEKTGSYYYHELGWLVKTDWFGCYDNPVITENPVSVVVPENDEVLFSVATADTVLRYEWYFNNTLLPQSDSNVLVIHPVTSAHKGEYYCMVRNECGSAKSEVARLDILGIDKKNTSNRIRVYPNPNNGQFHLLNVKQTDLDNISVYNSMGVKINHKVINPDIIILPDNLNFRGIYFLRCGEITLRLIIN